MKTTATLIKKELLKTNFKLTFSKQGGKDFFLILHGNQRKIYEELTINRNYFFAWKISKGYFFVIPQSIQAEAEINYLHKILGERIQLKDLTEKSLFDKLKQLEYQFNNYHENDKENEFLYWTEELITLLFLKFENLKAQRLLTDREEKELQTLTRIKAILLFSQDTKE